MFIKQVIRGRKTFYYLMESYRDLEGIPRQRTVQYLGNYESAYSILEADYDNDFDSAIRFLKLSRYEMEARQKIAAMPSKKRGRPKLIKKY